MSCEKFEFVVTKPKADVDLPKLAYSIREAAGVIGLSRAFLYAEWKAGRGPHKLKVGRRILITDEALKKWLQALQNS